MLARAGHAALLRGAVVAGAVAIAAAAACDAVTP